MQALPETIVDQLRTRFSDAILADQYTPDEVPTIWVEAGTVRDILRFLKTGIENPWRMLYDLTVIDERERVNRRGQPPSDFTLVYHLLSIERNGDIRVKVPLTGSFPSAPSITGIWKNADWYEREAYDMFGVTFEGHPRLRRILMPPNWTGHPLRREHPARATEMGRFRLPEEKFFAEDASLQFKPTGETAGGDDRHFDNLYLNVGPHHPGTHGVLRGVLRLDHEEIIDADIDIGFHHRGAEKMAERQSWHSYIPYTDRVDYVSGVLNNLAYLLGVEKLAGIEVPDRCKVIRVMLCELYRLASHLLFLGTYAQDLGQMSPIFYLFNDRERVLEITAAITGFRLHPGWFRIGGVAQDLPEGWEAMVRDLVSYLPRRFRFYERLMLKNRIMKARTVGIGCFTLAEAIEWGATGPMLRSCGLAWDLRKMRPYSGYEWFEFEVPTGVNGDNYDRAVIHLEEMRQSVRIIRQCLENMPPGPIKADHPLTTPPVKRRTMRDIETLITHFLNVTWGPAIPPGEALISIESSKGMYGYYSVSDGDVSAYRLRIRAPSFPHIQMVPFISRGYSVADFVSILGGVDYVMGDVDR